MHRPPSIVIPVLLAALGFAARVDAGLAPSKGSQLATIYATGSCPMPGYNPARSAVFTQMVRADGSVVPFVIPAKQIFVITDVTLAVSGHTAGDSTLSVLAIGTAASGAPVGTRFDTVSPSGTMTAVMQFPTGIAVKSTSVICGEVLNLTNGAPTGITAMAHGFFAPDK